MLGLKFLLAMVAVEALSEILTESRLTASLRRLPGALGYFFGCGYCASVWLGVGAAYLLRLEGVLEGLGAMEPAVWGLAVHRASNVFHEGVSRFLGRVPLALWLRADFHRPLPVDLEIPVEDESQPAPAEGVVEPTTEGEVQPPSAEGVAEGGDGGSE